MGLLFQLPFVAACVDMYANGPVKGMEANVALGLALSALVANDDLFYVAVGFVWVAIFVKAGLESTPELEVTEKVEESKEEVDDKKVPSPVKDVLLKSMQSFEKNLSVDTTCDGKQWKLQENSADLKIYNADYPGLSIKRWKVECEIEGKRDEIFDQLFDFSIRLGWDTALAHGEMLHEFDADGAGEKVVVNKIHTAAAGGGAVSSREMVDGGLLKYTEEGGLLFTTTSLGPEFKKHIPTLPKAVSNPIRATTHPGGGCALIPVDQSENPTKFKYVLISNVDLKGWLMTSVINSATTGALKDSTRAMKAHLTKALK